MYKTFDNQSCLIGLVVLLVYESGVEKDKGVREVIVIVQRLSVRVCLLVADVLNVVGPSVLTGKFRVGLRPNDWLKN